MFLDWDEVVVKQGVIDDLRAENQSLRQAHHVEKEQAIHCERENAKLRARAERLEGQRNELATVLETVISCDWWHGGMGVYDAKEWNRVNQLARDTINRAAVATPKE